MAKQSQSTPTLMMSAAMPIMVSMAVLPSSDHQRSGRWTECTSAGHPHTDGSAADTHMGEGGTAADLSAAVGGYARPTLPLSVLATRPGTIALTALGTSGSPDPTRLRWPRGRRC